MKSIQSLGFDPADVKIIIQSHGHFDHFGASPKMKDLYDTKILMSRLDTERIKINLDTALMKYAPEPYGPISLPDQTLEPGDIVELGKSRIRCEAAPGHTEGTMAFFFEAADGAETHTVGYIGGIGFLSLYKQFLKDYDLPADMQDRMAQTIAAMRKEHPDISLGNHPYHNGTLEKRQYMLDHPGENPFIDPTVWPEMLDALEKRLTDFRAKDY